MYISIEYVLSHVCDDNRYALFVTAINLTSSITFDSRGISLPRSELKSNASDARTIILRLPPIAPIQSVHNLSPLIPSFMTSTGYCLLA